MSAPYLGSLSGKRRYFPGERRRNLQTHRTRQVLHAARTGAAARRDPRRIENTYALLQALESRAHIWV
jgi:hypothetical protein